MSVTDNSANTKIYVVEERVNNHEIRIEKIESELPILTELKTILHMQVELAKNQSIQFNQSNEQAEKTFQAINQNLTQLNMTTDLLKESFNGIHTKIDIVDREAEDAIKQVREKMEAEIDKKKIDTSDWGVKIFYGLVTIVPSIILAWILAKSGLK